MDKQKGLRVYFTKPPNQNTPVAIDIFNIRGHRIRQLMLDPTSNQWNWPLDTDGGIIAAAGMYYYQVDSGPHRPLLILNQGQ